MTIHILLFNFINVKYFRTCDHEIPLPSTSSIHRRNNVAMVILYDISITVTFQYTIIFAFKEKQNYINYSKNDNLSKSV